MHIINGTVLVAILTAVVGLGAPVAALAQQNAGDPPGRVGRLAQASGTVSFHTAEETQWGPATLNYPVTSGNSFWTEPRSHAAVDVGSSRIYMDSSTELDVGTLDDQNFVASLPQGAVYLRVYNGSGQYEIDTPRGQVQLSQAGNYEIVAGDADHPTTVAVFAGSAQVTGPGVNLALGPQQSASISGQGNQLQASTGQAAPPDDFIQFVQGEERPYQNQASQPPPQYGSPEMTGYQDLNRYGSWQSSPDYGQVWYPQVAAGWAPYRYGHWAYVTPWGWTWVDDAPLGFAPFHYGRWVDNGGRWGWAPGAYERDPVYAPALVSFFGDFCGIGVGIAIGSAVGWVPLGYDEVYYPGYRASQDYLRRSNVSYVRNTTIINYNYYNSPQGNDYSRYRNHQHGATVVSGDAMMRSRPIGQAWEQIPQAGSSQPWQHAKSYGGQPPIKPSFATAGFDQAAARSAGIAMTGEPNKRGTPGPKIRTGASIQANQAQGTGNGQTLKNKGAPGSTVLPLASTNPTNVQPGAGVQGNQAQGTGNGQPLKNKGAPGPTVLPLAGTNQQNVQPGAGVQANQLQGTAGGKTLKNKGAPGPTMLPLASATPKSVQPGVGIQGSQTQGTNNGQTLKNRTAPVPAVLPYASNNRQKVQPSAGVRVKQVQGSGGLPLTTPRTTGSNLAPLASINPKHVQPGASVQLRKCAPGVTKC